ncbi:MULTISPECIES: hypothetical protein [Bacillus cereus group]|uniref:hypothetical protein n=1 Tax=Bacillus cereus group TaxID=86661 RepID=UPI000BF49807|nr:MULTISPECIES: hypothetical protein [Bacillus cereus group]KAA6457706.1 hypothetical protein DX930_29675 [Bacillus cereus]KAB2412498.1 hypothetical protein F8169_30355 [Bacillus cereus]KAB2435139.1 hypothetical protein F8166_17750 [Bacillus cereus]KAB2461749.1 hypothetical protein F8164_31140 [Bacillus cereus]PFL00152.1 hypothetical protein COJ28_31210 [Bacillus thuringiensis]
MSKKKVDKTYYLNETTVVYIKEYAEEKGIKPSHALERIVAEHQNQNHDLLEQIKAAVKEVVHEDLGRIRAGTNLTDKHTRMLLQFANHYFAVNKFENLATTSQYMSKGMVQAEGFVKDQISNARMKKIEREQGTSN